MILAAPSVRALARSLGTASAQSARSGAGTALVPPAPYAQAEPLTAAELLELDPQAAPERNVELRRESEEREDDPFDLPPEG